MKLSSFIFHPSSFVFLLSAFCLLIAFLPLPLPPYLDFQVLYHADLGLLQGIPLYDRAGQAEMIANLAGVTPDHVFVLPFPYPPWYALSTIFLALLPIAVAARLWFGLNLSMLMISVWLLRNGNNSASQNSESKNSESKNSESNDSSRWMQSRETLHSVRVLAKTLLYYLLAILFLPVLGSLFVGQFIFPVLLGASLLTFSLRRENVPLTALAAALLTFKPHLGGPLAGAALIYLFLRRDDFSRRALKAILVTALLLFAAGFLADPNWPANYLHSLLGFRDMPGVASCGLCASLPVALVNLVTGQTSIAPALPLGAALFIVFFGALFLFRREVFRTPELLVAASVLAALLADPYLLNYDFALLLAPLFLLSARRVDWLWLILAYLLPLLLLGLLGRAGSLYLPLAALLLFGLLLVRARNSHSVSLLQKNL
jgi:hypothetical protein